VKPYVKRSKHDPADAEACCEAVGRPSMRFVPVKTEAQQAVLGPAPGEWRGGIGTSRGRAHTDPFHVGARLGRGAVAEARV
jgi:hypothetical protein